jgi:hypothetical protein
MPSLGAGISPLAGGSVSSWDLGAAGVGVLDLAPLSVTAGHMSGGASAGPDVSDVRSVPVDGSEEDATPCISEPSPVAPDEEAPVGRTEDSMSTPSLLVAAGIPAQPVAVDTIMRHYAEVAPVDAGASVSGVDEGGIERYLLLPLLAGLAAHRSARSGEARRPLLEAKDRRWRGR